MIIALQVNVQEIGKLPSLLSPLIFVDVKVTIGSFFVFVVL